MTRFRTTCCSCTRSLRSLANSARTADGLLRSVQQEDHLRRGLVQVHRFHRHIILGKKRAQRLNDGRCTIAVAKRTSGGFERDLDVGRVVSQLRRQALALIIMPESG